MAGGAALPGSFLVGKQGGPEDLLSSYDQLGWDPRAKGALDKRFGLPMAAKASTLFQSLTRTLSPEAQKGLRIGSFCNFSRDDSSVNMLSAAALVNKAGLRGSLLPMTIGNRRSQSGGNSDVAYANLSPKALGVEKLDDLLGAVSYGPALSEFSDQQLKKLGHAIASLSTTQFRRLVQGSPAEQWKAFVESSYHRNMDIGQKVPGMDPREDQVFRDLYGLSSVLENSSDIVPAIVMNALRGNTGPGVITIGGCDYHDKTQETGDRKETQIGGEVGRAFEAAHRLKKSLCVQIITDGGLYAETGTRKWQGDSSIRSLSLICFYSPHGPVPQRRLQIGHYTDGQAVEQNTAVGSDPAKVALASFANYMWLNNRMGDYAKVIGRGGVTESELENILIFG